MFLEEAIVHYNRSITSKVLWLRCCETTKYHGKVLSIRRTRRAAGSTLKVEKDEGKKAAIVLSTSRKVDKRLLSFDNWIPCVCSHEALRNGILWCTQGVVQKWSLYRNSCYRKKLRALGGLGTTRFNFLFQLFSRRNFRLVQPPRIYTIVFKELGYFEMFERSISFLG